MLTVRVWLGFSSRTVLEWDFSKWLTQQARAIFSSFFYGPTVCFVNIMPAGRAFCCFTSNASSHQDEERQKPVGVGVDVWMGMKEGEKKRTEVESWRRDEEK